MPLYVYKCERCNAERSDMRKVDDRHIRPICLCGNGMALQIGAVPGIVRNPAVPRRAK